MFRFQPENEQSILALLDELQRLLKLPSRGHVVEYAVRKVWIAEKLVAAASSSDLDMACHLATNIQRDGPNG
jgi:hypothetical protein